MFTPLLFALVIGACIAWIWSSVFDTHGPWNSFFWFFAVIFLFAWGAGSWIAPFGPIAWGVAWLPIVCLGIFMALILTAVTPRSSRSRQRSLGARPSAPSAQVRALEKSELTVAADVFFWALIIVLGCVVLASFMMRGSRI